MIIGQTLMAPESSVYYFTPWFPRGGNQGHFAVEVIAATSNVRVQVFVQTKNSEDVDSSTGGTSRMRVRRDGDRRVRVFAKSGEDIPEPARS